MRSWLPTKGTLLLSLPGARSTLGATLKAALSTWYVLADGCTLSVLPIHGDFAFCLGLGLGFWRSGTMGKLTGVPILACSRLQELPAGRLCVFPWRGAWSFVLIRALLTFLAMTAQVKLTNSVFFWQNPLLSG